MKNMKVKNFRHAWLLLYYPIFITCFFLVEKLVNGQYAVMYVWLDGVIPFKAYFVVPYVLWYPYFGLAGLYLVFRDDFGFCRYMWSLILGLSFCLAFYVIYPNGQNLRPHELLDRDIFTRLVARLYAADSNLNVFPSIHVFATIAPTVAVLKNREAGKRASVRISLVLLCVLICLSTVFIKQHSVLDVLGGAGLYMIVYLLVYKTGGSWRLWTWPARPLRKAEGDTEGKPAAQSRKPHGTSKRPL